MLELTITELDDEGAGVGRAGRDEVHVAFTLPGERVRAAVEHRSPHGPRVWARLVEVLEPSPARRQPACPQFGRCGGCTLQHASYVAQLAYKRDRVVRALSRHPSLEQVAVAACAGAPVELGYRDQAKYVVARIRGAIVPASYAPRSHRPVDMTGCLVPEAPVQAVAEAAAAAVPAHAVPPYDERRAAGLLRYLVVRANHEGRVLLALVAAADFPGAAALAGDIRARQPCVAGVVLDVNPTRGGAIFGGQGRTLAGVDTLEERVGEVTLRLSARTFFQVNRPQAARLYALAVELCDPAPNDVVLDLYSGIGGIALSLAPRARTVIGLEADAPAVANARAAARGAEAARCEFREGDVADTLRAIAHADRAVLDPPRTGCAAAVIERLAAIGPRRVVYVSCEPRTLARDLDRLAAHGYRVIAVHPMDLFPGTPHVECVVALERR